MKILFDMECLQTASAFRGIGRYSLNLLKSLLVENRKEHDIHVLLNGKSIDSECALRRKLDSTIEQSRIHFWPSPLRIGCLDMTYPDASSHVAAVRQLFIEKINPDHFHVFSHFEGFLDYQHLTKLKGLSRGITTSVSIYDFIPLEMKDIFLKDQRYNKFYHEKLKDLLRADQLLTISHYTLAKIKYYLPDFGGNSFNIGTGISNNFSRTQKETTLGSKRPLDGKPYVLCLGSIDPHKNIAGLASAWLLVAKNIRDKYELVLAGSKSSFPESVATKICHDCGLANGQFRILNSLTDNELSDLYAHCEVYIQPSICEGFGLPVGEAINCGALAIGSDRSSLPEILKSPEAMFDPNKPESIAGKLQEVLSGSINRSSIQSIQKENIHNYTWQNVARRFFEVIENKNADAPKSKPSPWNQASLGKRFFSKLESCKQGIEASAEQLAWISANLERCENLSKTTPRVFIDISELIQRDAGTGVQRVTRAVLHGLMNRKDESFQCIPVYGNQEIEGYRYANEYSQKNFGRKFACGDVGISPESGDIFLGLDLQHHVTRKQANYLSILADQGVRVIFYLYDLLPIQYPIFWPLEHGLDVVHHEWLNIICSFDEVISISATTAKRGREFLASPPMPRYPYPQPFLTRPVFRKKGGKAKISHNLLGYDVDATAPSTGLPGDAQETLRKMRERTTFLMVGTLEPRKGQSQILQAFNQMWAKGSEDQLVIVGKAGWLMDDFVHQLQSHRMLGSQLFWFNKASDEYLKSIYDASTCLIAASYDEGFGLPLVEAARFGKPIIARDIEIHREVAGCSAFYFKGLDIEEINHKIEKWKKLYNADQHPKPNIALRTWGEHVEQLVETLKSHISTKE
jgi:glycosyltransferase involved in cell wall biosynthesis